MAQKCSHVEVSDAYLIKSEKCIGVAKLAYEAEIYENAISGHIIQYSSVNKF